MASQVSPKPFHWYFTEDYKGIRFHNRVVLLTVLLFIFVLIFNAVFLYWQWLSRRRAAARSQSYAANTQQPAACRGLDPPIIDSFPIVLYGSLGDSGAVEETECSICLGAFQKEEKIKVLPRCRHAYHAPCVDAWLRTQSSCPLCRASLRLDPPLHESAISLNL